MYSDGHIKLFRQMLDWEWYKDNNTKSLFIHLLFKANWKDGRFMGREIPRGSLVTSVENLSAETGITRQSIRTSLNKLEQTGEISKISTNKFTIINLVNYRVYQDEILKTNKQLTNNQQTTNKQLTTIEERKKEIKKEYINNIYTSTGVDDVKTDYDFYMNTFNDICKDLPKVKSLSDTRKKILKKIDPNEFKQICELVNESDFLCGRMGNKNEWSATFDWIVKPNNRIKILEGNYKNKKGFFEELLEGND